MLMRIYVAVSLLLIVGGMVCAYLMVDTKHNTKLEARLLQAGAVLLGAAGVAAVMLVLAISSELLHKAVIFILTGE